MMGSPCLLALLYMIARVCTAEASGAVPRGGVPIPGHIRIDELDNPSWSTEAPVKLPSHYHYHSDRPRCSLHTPLFRSSRVTNFIQTEMSAGEWMVLFYANGDACPSCGHIHNPWGGLAHNIGRMVATGESTIRVAKINVDNDPRWARALAVERSPEILRIANGGYVHPYKMETFARTAAAFTKFAVSGYLEQPVRNRILLKTAPPTPMPREWFSAGTVSRAAALGFFALPAVLALAIRLTMGFAKFHKAYVERPYEWAEQKWFGDRDIDSIMEEIGDGPTTTTTPKKRK